MYRAIYTLLMAALAITVAVVGYLVLTGQRTLEPNYILLLAVFVLIVHGVMPLIRRFYKAPPRR